MDRCHSLCVWFMARNCQFPTVGTHGCQHGPQVPIAKNFQDLKVGTVPGWRAKVTMARNCPFPDLKLTVPNLGTRGYHGKELRVPRG